ncbi:hypothetical protein [Paraflavitalea sp. CAU 1676]|uniref:hypothetical protein n=1 Tax=Paraflavitalea sp. CAU 1676 TaxID=3032598 RepID=UPI0023D9804B|nr:hypothetical protein [Paraflavitalea sp. CAU 1676]MDF2189072.1 hypothetical protein [Paraflavitalea sp. CAU 1676]
MELADSMQSLQYAYVYLVNSNRDIKEALYSKARFPRESKEYSELMPYVKKVGANTGELLRWIKGVEEGYWDDETAPIPPEIISELHGELIAFVKAVTDSIGMKQPWLWSGLRRIRQGALYRLQLTADSSDNSPIKASVWGNNLLNKVSKHFQKAMLRKLSNDVLLIEHDVLSYYLQAKEAPDRREYSFEPIITLDRSSVKQGGRLVLTAGVAAFAKNHSIVMSVNGNPVSVNEHGVGIYRLVAGLPGKYNLKLEVAYVQPDGSPSTIWKNISYTVTR